MRNIKSIFLALIVLNLVFSCKKDDSEPAKTGGSTNTSVANSIQVNINGTDLLLESGVNNYHYSNEFNSNGNVGSDIASGRFAWIIAPDNFLANLPAFNIIFDDSISLSGLQNNPDQVLEDVFTPGDRCFFGDTSLCSLSKALISYYDANNVSWFSHFIDQPGDSHFNISTSLPALDANGNKVRNVKGTFSCWVANMNGDSLKLNNAAFNFYYKQ